MSCASWPGGLSRAADEGESRSETCVRGADVAQLRQRSLAAEFEWRGEQMTTLVVLDSFEALPGSLQLDDMSESLAIRPERGSVYLLSFNPDAQVVEQILEALRQQGIEAQYITAAGKLDSVALQAREKFSKLVAEVPVTFSIGSKNLKHAFTFEGCLSLWWLNDLSSKRSDAYPTFTRICQLEVIRDVARSAGAHTIDLITQDCDLWDVVAAYCQQAGIDLRSERPERRYWSSLRRSLATLRILAGSVKWFLRTGIQTLLAKLLVGSSAPSQKELAGLCAFYTHYPGMWRGTSGKRDEKYAGVPDLIERISGIAAIYACTFSSDGVHQSVSIRDYYRYCQWLRARRRTADECRIHLMDADLKWRDFWRAIGQISIVWKYLWLENNPDFRKQWGYDGIDVFPLVRREFHIAMVRIPRYLLHLMRVRRFVEKAKPRCFVSSLFEFCYGRAIVYGVKTANAPPPVIGVQHGPIAKRKLLYYHYPGELRPCPTRPGDFIENIPIPDWIILEGYGAKERLAEAGYPVDRLIVAGAPRLGRLLRVPPKSSQSSSSPDHPKKVLVVFGQHDGAAILSACLPVMAKLSNCHFVFKLHPRSGLTAEAVEEVLNREQVRSTYEIATGSIYNHLSEADVVLVTYSSVGMEAVARGYPVICLQLPNVVNTSPILDIETPGVLKVTSGPELENALREELDVVFRADRDHCDVVQYFFGQLDDNVEQRWAKAIVEVITSRDVWTSRSEG